MKLTLKAYVSLSPDRAYGREDPRTRDEAGNDNGVQRGIQRYDGEEEPAWTYLRHLPNIRNKQSLQGMKKALIVAQKKNG